MEFKDITRTMGDGMDNALLHLPEAMTKTVSFNLNLRSPNQILNSLRPVEPKSKLINLQPKYIPKEQKVPKYLLKKPKEPKFVPYEPYKAAVEPIVPLKTNKIVLEKKPTKNNVEIQQLVNQMSELRASEMNKSQSMVLENTENFISKNKWEKEKQSYEIDIKNLRETMAHLENQLKFQAQVNSELKTLLVAAVGEDLETRVQHLTEDKLQLARALLNSANHLTSHQEQTEWLSGQCEVWRSKFLASSLMVEELAHWKSALATRINELQNSIKSLLEEHSYSQKQSLNTYCNLKAAAELLGVDNNQFMLKSATCIEVSQTNLKLAESIDDHLKVPRNKVEEVAHKYSRIESNTLAEKHAMKMLQNPVKITNKEAICNALVGAATSLYGEHHCQTTSFHGACCGRCKGEMQIL